MGKLFEIQPEWCRQPVKVSEIKNFEKLHARYKKLVQFDPTEAYKRIDEADVINPKRRYNSVYIGLIFPKRNDGLCTCGCGLKLEGRRTVWATEDCSNFPGLVWSIITGHSSIINICGRIFGTDCVVCGKSEQETGETHELDHKFPVKFGGAGGWLSNYEFKCKKCHREKTNKDFGFGKHKPQLVNQTSLF